MRIAYCTNVRLPSERAHGHQIAQVCDALAVLGHDITVFAPFRKNIVKEDYHTYYGARPQVHLKHLGRFDFIASPFFPGVLGLLAMNFFLRRNLLRTNIAGFDLIYTRTSALLPALLSTGVPTALELHQLPRRSRSAFVRHCNRCKLVICLTSSMRDTLVSWGVNESILTVEGDAVDLHRFENMPALTQARKHFAVTTHRPVIGYVGRLKTLGQDKGVSDLLRAVAQLKTETPVFGFVVGGPESDRTFYEKQARDLGLTDEDVLFTGEIPSKEIPMALSACDIVTMPFPDTPHFRRNMSPLKMFEYMAAGKPIITSDLPPIRDVLSEETAFFFRPGHLRDFIDRIKNIITNPEDASHRSERARKLVSEHTWEKRMSRILQRAS